MDIKILTVSKQCSDIIYQDTIHIEKLANPDINEFYDAIHKLYPTLFIPEDCTFYWQYSQYYFFQIFDFFSYLTVLTLIADPRIYLLLDDCDGECEENEFFLRQLDKRELEEEIERNRDIYDVKIVRPGDVVEPIEEEPPDSADVEARTDGDILAFALRKTSEVGCYTADMIQRVKLISDIKKAMKGEIISCSHKDIYFLETNTKSENANLENLFASPAGREMLKYKSRSKLKQKLNPAVEFFIHNNKSNSQQQAIKVSQEAKQCPSTSSHTSDPDNNSRRSSCRKSSFDLYEEATTILGLTCSQTDNCRCIECQCHYFDFEEEIDFPTGSECVMDHNSSCSIQ